MLTKSIDDGRRQSSRLQWLSFAMLIGMAMLAVLSTAAVLEIQAGVRAYLVADYQWTKAQDDALYQLLLYLDLGEQPQLRRVRDALEVPLADRRARLALEHNPPDRDAARRAFLRGRNPAAGVTQLVRLYRCCSTAPYMRDAVRAWRLGDSYILDLQTLADKISHVHDIGHMDPGQRQRFRATLIHLGQQIHPLEDRFAQDLTKGARWLGIVLLAITAGIFTLMTVVSIVIYRMLLRRIRKSEGDFRAAFAQAAVGMAQLDGDGRFLAVNETLGKILDRSRDEMRAANLRDVIHPEDSAGDPWQLQRLMAGDLESHSMERRYLRGDGQIIWARMTLSAVRGTGHGPDRLFAVLEDVSKARDLTDALYYQATHDRLTGLINRHEIELRLQQALDTARSDAGYHSLLFIDLDQFKVVNDTCGHVAGDALLCDVANLLKQQLRASDTVGRLGGDEFAVILHGTAADRARPLAEKLRNAVANMAFRWQGRNFNLTSSIGLVEINRDAQNLTWLLSAADTACYLAKDLGRNRVHAFEENDQSVIERRGQMEWVSDIRQAIDENRLRLYAQRIIPLDGPEALCYEILVRLLDPEGRIYAPGSFLPAAERYDMASAIDRWVFDTAITTLQAHPEHVHRLGLCHINLSAQSITDADFLHFVEQRLDTTSVPPQRICFEITETAAMSSLQDARRFIDAMHARGCVIALDDFGSGLSSFGYLKHLPVDILKIDGIFVRDIAKDRVDLAIVSSINEMGKVLGKRIIAEFAEDDATITKLREIGVDYAQGFGIHRPAPLEELLGLPARVDLS